MKITSRSRGLGHGESSITIDGSEAEIAAIEAAMSGLYWVTVNEDKEVIKTKHYDGPTVKEPVTVPDPQLFDFWPKDNKSEYVLREFRGFNDSPRNDPAIFIQSIAGYGGDEKYKRNERLLRAAGFVCLRSRRGEDDGRYWEIWYLPFALRAEVVGQDTDEILEWVRTRIGPGSISVEGRYYGLCAPD